MSMSALGDQCTTKKLEAKQIVAKETKTPTTIFYSDADTGGSTITKGLVMFRSNGGAIAMTLPNGTDGDIVEFVHIVGGNLIDITGAFRAPAAKVRFSATAGGYVKCLWHSTAWFIIGRDSDALAGATAVANMPEIQ